MFRRLLVGALVLLPLLAIPSSAAAGPGFLKAIWGPIKIPPGQAGCAGPARCSAFPFYRQLRAQVFQYQIQWNRIAPTRPANPRDPDAYDWPGEFDFAVQQAAASGMHVSFLIKGSPQWANGGRSWNWAPHPAHYADFAYAAARRFPGVRLWQIWGEPTRQNNFMPQGRKGARAYARILNRAYGALKSANPRNIVIGGMTFHGGYTRTPKWIRYLRLPNGKPPRMDWWGHNPFEARFPNIRRRPIGTFRGLSDVDTLWREIRRHYMRWVRVRRIRCRDRPGWWRRPCYRRRWIYRPGRGRPAKLWLSEWTIQSDRGSYVFPYAVSRREQARRLRAAYALARKVRYVKGMGWYQLFDFPDVDRNPTWGLMTYDGVKKPAYWAYRALP